MHFGSFIFVCHEQVTCTLTVAAILLASEFFRAYMNTFVIKMTNMNTG